MRQKADLPTSHRTGQSLMQMGHIPLKGEMSGSLVFVPVVERAFSNEIDIFLSLLLNTLTREAEDHQSGPVNPPFPTEILHEGRSIL